MNIALGYHGHYRRIGARHSLKECSDLFDVYTNHKVYLYKPLNITDVYFHTYSFIQCPADDEKLVKLLNPVSYVIEHKLKPYIVDSMLEVMKLIKEQKRNTHFILARFDSLYTRHFTQQINWSQINIAFRDIYLTDITSKTWKYYNRKNNSHLWRNDYFVSDLFFTFPSNTYNMFENGLLFSKIWDVERVGHGHWIYLFFKHWRSPVNFISRSISGSRRPINTFLNIQRSCHSIRQRTSCTNMTKYRSVKL